MNGPGILAFRVAHLLRGSRSLRMLPEMLTEPYRSPQEIQQIQLGRIRELLRHSQETVPYYRELFKDIGLQPQEVRSFKEFAQIPELTKDILRASAVDLISSSADRSKLLKHNSGGSTGVPISFYRDRFYLDSSDAGTYRNLMQCGWIPGEMMAFVWGYNERLEKMSKLEFALRQHLRRAYQFNPFQSSEADLDEWIGKLASLRPTVVLGYASTIARLASRIREKGAALPPFRGIFTTAEKLYPSQREDIESAFKCRAFDLYGSSEIQNIAAQCREGAMHVNSDFCHLEFGEAEAGQVGRPVIVTSLKSRAFPFIRYRNEDFAQAKESDICKCGSGFPVISLTVARESDNFILANGQVVHGEFFTHLMYGAQGITQFQFHQTQTTEIVLRYTGSADSESADRSARLAAAEMSRHFGDELVVVLERVDSIPLSKAGKHRFTISDVSQSLRKLGGAS